MYVCLCNEVTDHQIRDAAMQGARDVYDLEHRLGVASHCGRCRHVAADVLEEALEGGARAPALQPA